MVYCTCRLAIWPIESDSLIVKSKSPLANHDTMTLDCDKLGTSMTISWILINPDTMLNGHLQSTPMLINCGEQFSGLKLSGNKAWKYAHKSE